MRTALSSMLLAVYGATALLGQGLHELAGCDHHHDSHADCCSHHECCEAASELGATVAAEQADDDVEHCPICQHLAQGQLAAHRVRSCVGLSPVLHSRCEIRLPLLRQSRQPYGARAPPSLPTVPA